MEQQNLEERFADFDEILTHWLENNEEFFAAVLLQTYAWWRGDQIDLGLDIQCDLPLVMHSDIAAIVEHHADPTYSYSQEDATFVIIPLPSLFQREYKGRGNQTIAEETRATVQQQAKAQGVSEVEVLLARFRVERAFLADFLREEIRAALGY